jgi:hypothetical protein
MFFTFPQDACWNAERQAVEFGVAIGEYEGVVRRGGPRGRDAYQRRCLRHEPLTLAGLLVTGFGFTLHRMARAGLPCASA